MKFAWKDKQYQGLGAVLYLEHDSLTDLLLAASSMPAEIRPVGETVTFDRPNKSGNRGQSKFWFMNMGHILCNSIFQMLFPWTIWRQCLSQWSWTTKRWLENRAKGPWEFGTSQISEETDSHGTRFHPAVFYTFKWTEEQTTRQRES